MFRGVCSGLLPVILALSLAAVGCTKRIPVESGEFDVSQKVVLTLTDGRTLEGRIGAGQRVEYRAEGAVYRGRVASLSTDSIELNELLLIDREDYELVDRRLADAKLQVTDPVPPIVIARAEIDRVERVQMDGYRTARGIGFWAYGSAMFLLLLGERS